jgi:hypothetical protein
LSPQHVHEPDRTEREADKEIGDRLEPFTDRHVSAQAGKQNRQKHVRAEHKPPPAYSTVDCPLRRIKRFGKESPARLEPGEIPFLVLHEIAQMERVKGNPPPSDEENESGGRIQDAVADKAPLAEARSGAFKWEAPGGILRPRGGREDRKEHEDQRKVLHMPAPRIENSLFFIKMETLQFRQKP